MQDQLLLRPIAYFLLAIFLLWKCLLALLLEMHYFFGFWG